MKRLLALLVVVSACSGGGGAGPTGSGGSGTGGTAGEFGPAGSGGSGGAGGAGAGAGQTPDGGDASVPAAPARWLIDNLTSIHGLTPTVIGAPVVTSTPQGDALCFDGNDGIVVDDHPLDGLGAFTLEVLVRIDPVTSAAFNQPRFLHIEAAGPARATIEARVTDTSFYLDSFLLAGAASRTLADSSKVHPLGSWTWTALTYDGTTMRHYVEGVEDASGLVAVPAFGPGKLSLGVRQNLVYWFVGCIRELRVTPTTLPPAQLQRVL